MREAGSTRGSCLGTFDVPPSLFREAGVLPGTHLRSLDAIHLAAAIRLGVECLVTYDSRMIAAAREIGVKVFAPGLGEQDMHR